MNDKKAPIVDINALHQRLPILGICYGAQLTAKQFGGRVANSSKREYGRALLQKQKDGCSAAGCDRKIAGMDEPCRYHPGIAG